jgi:predicted P-loop ATPase
MIPTEPAIVTPFPPTAAEWIKFYQRQGLRLFYWERSGDPANDWKKAIGKSWNRRDIEPDDLSKFDPSKHNLGTIIGYEVKPGRYLVDVDIDWDSPRELLQLLPGSEFIFGRAGKNVSHTFYTTPERLPSVKEYKDIDGKKFMELFGGDFSQYTMVPPSLRSPGTPLVPVQNSGITHIEVDELHRHLRNYAIAVLLYKHFGKGAVVHDVRLPLAGFLLKSGLSEEDTDSIGHAVTMATGNDVNDWKTALKTTLQRIKAGEKVQGRARLAESLGDVGKRVVAQLIKFVGGSEFIVNENGTILADSTENIRTALNKLDVDLSFDKFAEQLVYQRGNSPRKPLDDSVRIPLRFEIEDRFRFRPNDKLFADVLLDTAYRHEVHPVIQWIETLPTWDQTSRLDTWLINAGAPDTAYVRSISRKALIAAVRRIRKPGCKFDTMLILENEQGKNKSSAIRILAVRDEWFSDQLPLGAGAKEVIERTAGKWIIEAAELHTRASDVEHLKVFMSAQTDGPVRLAYARFPTHRDRQFILIGTTNGSSGYLKDQTGNRRFWPVAIGTFDLEALRRDREQLWAEAVAREAAGESIQLEEELWPAAAVEQEKRRESDDWEDVILEQLDIDDPRVTACPADWTWKALQIEQASQKNPMHSKRIRQIMERHGFKAKIRVWVRVWTEVGAGSTSKIVQVRKRLHVWLKACAIGVGDSVVRENVVWAASDTASEWVESIVLDEERQEALPGTRGRTD